MFINYFRLYVTRRAVARAMARVMKYENRPTSKTLNLQIEAIIDAHYYLDKLPTLGNHAYLISSLSSPPFMAETTWRGVPHAPRTVNALGWLEYNPNRTDGVSIPVYMKSLVNELPYVELDAVGLEKYYREFNGVFFRYLMALNGAMKKRR